MAYFNLTENSKKIKQPKGLKMKLREHQLTAISAMRDLESQAEIIIDQPEVGSGLHQSLRYKITDQEEFTSSTYIISTNTAILADKVGAGKTLDVVGLIKCKQVPDSHGRYVLGTDHYSIKMISPKECVKCNLIVVPHNLSNQWGEFFAKSDLKYLVLNSNADFDVFYDIKEIEKLPVLAARKYNATYTPIRKGRAKAANPNKNNFIERVPNDDKINKILNNNSAIVLNVNRYKLFKVLFRKILWARVIIDEMDSANVPPTFEEYGNFNWFLTATPHAIFEKSCRRYVGKIFNYQQQKLINYFTVKNEDTFVDKVIALPKPNVFMIKTVVNNVVAAVQDLLPKDVLQLINAGNMKEAVQRLNCDEDTEENILKVLTSKIEIELHNAKKELEYVKGLIPLDEEKVKKIEGQIVSFNTRIETIKERIGSVENGCCFICTEPFNTPAILDCCKSVFCLACLLSSFRLSGNKCPFCRHQLKGPKDYKVISKKVDKKKPEKKAEKKKGQLLVEMEKTDVLEELLSTIAKETKNPKILIFSDFRQTFDKIIKNIAKAKLQYAMITGTPAHISNVIDSFDNGDMNILMLDSGHYGAGLNLQKAEYLILFHRMNPGLETQVIGRAQRSGRVGKLKIIYLVNDTEDNHSPITRNPIVPETTDDMWMICNPELLKDGGKSSAEEVDDADTEEDDDDIPADNNTESSTEEDGSVSDSEDGPADGSVSESNGSVSDSEDGPADGSVSESDDVPPKKVGKKKISNKKISKKKVNKKKVNKKKVNKKKVQSESDTEPETESESESESESDGPPKKVGKRKVRSESESDDKPIKKTAKKSTAKKSTAKKSTAKKSTAKKSVKKSASKRASTSSDSASSFSSGSVSDSD